MFVSPFSITVIISATRMHRCLVDFASRPPDMYETLRFLSFLPAQCFRRHFRPHENLQVSSLEFSEAKRTDTAPNTLHRIEIVMDTASCDTSTREQVS
jgi:hypothetical protein